MIIIYLVFVATALLALFRVRTALVLPATILAISAPFGWMVHNINASDRFSFISSWDGESLFRGFNSETKLLYPDVSLDLLIAEQQIRLRDGSVIDIVPKPQRSDFKNEWDWNDYYKTRILQWIRANPGETLELIAIKAKTFFFSVDKVPKQYGADGISEPSLSQGAIFITRSWLLVGRLFEGIEVLLIGALCLKGTARALTVAITAIALNAAYAAPYVIGFAYERHFSVYLLIVCVCNLFLSLEWLDKKVIE